MVLQVLLAFIALLLIMAGIVASLDRLSDHPVEQSKPYATETSDSANAGDGLASRSANMSAGAPAVTGGGGMLGGLMRSGLPLQAQRVYTPGTRLDELLTWSSVEATEALYQYILQMEGEEQEALFNALPQVATWYSPST